MKTFADKVIHFYNKLQLPKQKLPNQIEWIGQLFEKETIASYTAFYQKYYADNQQRTLLLGINPGRFGAGVTGVPFTDPIYLEKVCGISNNFEKRHELSSKFIYEVISNFGGPISFFSQVYISSILPVGLIKGGKNINYYDDLSLQKMLWPFMAEQIEKQLSFGFNRNIAFSIGAGKNLKVLQKLNEENNWFKRVEALPHPRWVMQYRLKKKQVFIDEYVSKINLAFS